MIRVRVDDYPQTRGEPQHTQAAFREFHRCLSHGIDHKRYLLGVIPGRCTVDDILLIRNETDCVIGMHGIDHDEAKLDIYQNEFPPYLSREHIRDKLREARDALASAVGRPVSIYMPPRNQLDVRTIFAFPPEIRFYTTGPETTELIRTGAQAIHSQPPHEYGRTDEMYQRKSHQVLSELVSQMGRDVVLTLHWTWETNIGLSHMRRFLEQIPNEYFADFDA